MTLFARSVPKYVSSKKRHWTFQLLKCSNAAHCAARREAAWIQPKIAFFG